MVISTWIHPILETSGFIDWDSGNNAIKYTYPEPDGSNSVYVRGTYTYQAEDFLDLKLPYFSYNLELDPVVGDNWTYNKFWIRGTILPQIALGTFGSNEEIETRVDINNANNQDVTGALRFYRTGGTPWPIKIGETTSDEHPFTVKANSNLSLTLRSMDSAAAGWALAYGDKGLDFSASYTTKSEDKITHEAGFSGQLPGTFNVLGTKYDLSAGLDTAYAIVNPTTSTAQIHATYTPDGGTPIMKELTLMPMYSRPVFASDLFELSGSGSGSATFESYTDVTVSSLRTMNGRQLSSLPGGRWQIGF
jgi:hypothetical protein